MRGPSIEEMLLSKRTLAVLRMPLRIGPSLAVPPRCARRGGQ